MLFSIYNLNKNIAHFKFMVCISIRTQFLRLERNLQIARVGLGVVYVNIHVM